MDSFKVHVEADSYPVYVGYGILANLAEMITLYGLGKGCLIITDANVERLYKAEIDAVLASGLEIKDTLVVPAGEGSKSLSVVEKILTTMLEREYDRTLIILALGGGVVGDLAGFIASIYKRGIRYVQVPTTLLAQVDSSIGGKTGVNHAAGKNLIGSFYQPKLVWSDLRFLSTLPKREIVCGLGEVVKYGMIRDTSILTLCEERFDDFFQPDCDLLASVVAKCGGIKAAIVSKDEREKGMRMILNFGHTIGHAIEAALAYQRISHGEAVLAGILAESHISVSKGNLPHEQFQRLETLVQRFELGGKLHNLKADHVERFIRNDKKCTNGRSRFILPTSLGVVTVFDDVEPSLVRGGIDYVIDLFSH